MAEIDKLLEIMRHLRDPESGCPWDLEQDAFSIAPHTVEEAYEVQSAIAKGLPEAICDELGDLLFQVVFQARLAEEAGQFNFDDVVRGISAKLTRRHPHVFDRDNAVVTDAAGVAAQWEAIKAAERASQATETGTLDGIPQALPALARAEKLGQRAATVGFDWGTAADVRRQIDLELDEFDAASAESRDRQAEELADVLFSAAQLSRHLGIKPEAALVGGNSRFEQRFRWMEERAGGAHALRRLDPDGREALWSEAKRCLNPAP